MRTTPREVQDRCLTQEQQAVLTGTLLGDGSLPIHGRNPRLFVKHKADHEALALFKYEIFREFISMRPHYFSQRLNGRNYPAVQFVTRTNAVFAAWRWRFYRERRKIVPVDIACDLSPLALAVWLMDDGAADYAGLTFQTHGFTRSETNRLAAALRRNYGLRTGVRANRGSWIVYVFAEGIPRLRQIVAPHVLPEFEYKLIPRRSITP
jgi:LAGLIDADG DNA endonuclease family protein